MNGLTYIRKLNNLSMQDLAEMLDITKQTISKWETNQKSISDKRLKQLSELFHIKESYFKKELTFLEQLEVQKSKINKEFVNYSLHFFEIIKLKNDKIPNAGFNFYKYKEKSF